MYVEDDENLDALLLCTIYKIYILWLSVHMLVLSFHFEADLTLKSLREKKKCPKF